MHILCSMLCQVYHSELLEWFSDYIVRSGLELGRKTIFIPTLLPSLTLPSPSFNS